MTIRYKENDATRTVEIAVDGHVTAEDYAAAIAPMQSFIDRHGTIKFIEVVESFKGFDPSIIWEGLKFDIRNLSHISHVAVVSDVAWVSPMSNAVGAFLTTELKTFRMAELEDARAWAQSE